MGPPKKTKMGHVTSPRPFKGWFVVCRLGLSTINLCTKFEVSTFTNWVIESYLSKFANFNLPHQHLAPTLGMTPFEFRRDLWLAYRV